LGAADGPIGCALILWAVQLSDADERHAGKVLRRINVHISRAEETMHGGESDRGEKMRD